MTRFANRRRGLAAVLTTGLVVAAALTGASADALNSCVCIDRDAEAIVASHERQPDNLLFLGQRTSEVTDSPTTFRVDRVYSGSFTGDEIKVEFDGGSIECPSHFIPSLLTRVYSTQRAGELWRMDHCGTFTWSPLAIGALIDGLPEPASNSPPEFVVATHMTPATLALLDSRGAVTRYATTPGPLKALIACPGEERIAALLRPHGPEREANKDLYRVEIRSVLDLAVEASIDFSIPRTENGRRANLVDLECHDATGNLVTFLASERSRHPESGADEFGDAQVFVVADGAVDRFDVGVARRLSVDPVTRLAYTINGFDGRTVASWNLETGAEVQRAQLPGQHVGWQIDSVGGGVRLLARGIPLEGRDRMVARVNTVLVGPIDDLLAKPLGTRARLTGYTDNGDGLVAVMHNPPEVVFVDAEGDVEVFPFRVGQSGQLAVGSESVLADHVARSTNVRRVTSMGGTTAPLLGVEEVYLAARIGDDPVPSLSLPAVAEPVPDPGDAFVAADPTSTAETEAGWSRRVTVLVVVAGLVAAAVALFIIRGKRPTPG